MTGSTYGCPPDEAYDEDIRPPSITTDGAPSILQRLSEAAGIDIDRPKHDYLAPHGGRRGMGEVLVRAFGYGRRSIFGQLRGNGPRAVLAHRSWRTRRCGYGSSQGGR